MYDPNFKSDFANSVIANVITDAVSDPLNSQLQDGPIVSLRAKLEKDLPPAPREDRRGYVAALVEDGIASGALSDGDAMPETIAELNERLAAEKAAEERERLRRLLNL